MWITWNLFLSRTAFFNSGGTKEIEFPLLQRYRTVKQNIAELTGTLRKSLILREEAQEVISDYGIIVPNRLWRAGRTPDPKLFVRKLKNHNMDLGVAVLGVFAGEEQDLQIEKRIFGKDFAYIKYIEQFSRIVGKYLVRQWEDE